MNKKDNRLIGRGSEVLLNKKLHKIVKQLETLTLGDEHELIRKPTGEKSLWIDKENNNDLKYYENGKWNLFYNDRFKITSQIIDPYMPKNPVPGQLWINEGILMYFDGTEWMVVRAGDINKEDFNIANYHDFVLIDHLIEQGNFIVDSTAGFPIRKSQFLVPNEYTTKFFIDGNINSDYDAVTNVAIQYETDRIKDKITSAVHINPSNLIDIQKRLILIDKKPENNIIRVNSKNTEFYGMTHGKGSLLVHGNDYNRVSGNYIKLRERVQRKYDFILAIEYIFGKTKHEGILKRQSLDMRQNTSTVIKTNKDPQDYRFIIFQDGYAKNITSDKYEIKDNHIILKSLKKESFTQILSIHEDNILDEGTIFNNRAVVKGVKNQDALILVETNKGFELRRVEVLNEVVYLKKTLNDSRFLLFKEERNKSKQSIQFKESGLVKDGLIKANISGRENVLLFLNNKLVSQNEYRINRINNFIEIDSKYNYYTFELYNDDHHNILIDQKIKDMIVPISSSEEGNFNKTIAYIDEYIVCDESTVLSYRLPNKGYHNEIKKILKLNGESVWYIYKKDRWVELINPTTKEVQILSRKKDRINLPEELEVYDVNNMKDINMEATRLIQDYFKAKIEDIENFNVEKYQDSVMISSSYNGENISFSIKLKEVEIKTPYYIYSDEIDLIKEAKYKKSNQDIIDHLESNIIKEIKDKVKFMNNGFITRETVLINNDKAKIKVVKDYGQEEYNSYEDYKEGLGLIDHLEFTTSTYIEDNNTINISNHLSGHMLKTYSYKFASHIEKPRNIKEIDIDLIKNNDSFIIDYHKFFEPYNEELSIYLDGVKQYRFEEVNNNAFRFYGNHSIHDPRFAKAIAVSEPVEGDDGVSSQREIIELSKHSPGMFNTYKTSIDLYPGYNRIFIDGIRQSENAYQILDSNTIMLKNIQNEDIENSTMLIEHKNDLSINEAEIEISEPLKGGIINIKEYDIDESILESNEEILIYIDGVLLGNQYEIDKEIESIIITSSISNYIGKNMIYYELVEEYQDKINKYKDLLTSKEMVWEEKQLILKEIKILEEKISKLDIKSTTNIIFEWR